MGARSDNALIYEGKPPETYPASGCRLPAGKAFYEGAAEKDCRPGNVLNALFTIPAAFQAP